MNTKFKLGLVAATVLLTIGQCALAADALEPPAAPAGGESGVDTYGQLDALNAHNAILNAVLKNLELKKKITDARNGVDTSTPGQRVQASEFNPSIRGAGPTVRAAPSIQMPSAQVQMVSGVGRQLTAIIALPNGSHMNVREGATIPGLGVVKSISVNEVIVQDKKQVISLPFASDTAGTPGLYGMTGAGSVGMPMPSPMPAGRLRQLSGGVR